MEEYYTIQTPNHHSALFTELHVLQKQGVLCDVTLVAEDGEVMAHKVVLMAASKYFREKLSPVLGPNPSKVCLKGISVVELSNLIKYIYTGKLLVSKETMDIILEISEILGLNGVIQGYKDIITYEELKGKMGDQVQSKVVPSQTVSSSESTIASSDAPVASSDAAQGTSAVVSQTSKSSIADQNKKTQAILTKNRDGNNATVLQTNNSGEVVENTNQATSADFNFSSLYDQQYMDINAGSNTPQKISPACGSQTTLSPLKQHVAPAVSAVRRNIAEEEAQHQDLLTVAIETLSDAPYLKHQGQPEIEKAVMSISDKSKIDASATTTLDKPKAENNVDVEPFINGKTNTKTFTMSAGSVNNELGGKTDVYTVSLVPSCVKVPLVMPRPKRSKSQKEKEAEEKARMYRQKKAQILQSDLTGVIKDQALSAALKKGKAGSEGGREQRIRNTTQNQDFRYESLSKTKKKAFVPKVVFSNEQDGSKSGHMNEEVSESLVNAEEQSNTHADKIAQVKFDSDGEDDDGVDGMIANDIVDVMSNSVSSESYAGTKHAFTATRDKNVSLGEGTKSLSYTKKDGNILTEAVPDVEDVAQSVDVAAERYIDNSDVTMSPMTQSDDDIMEKIRSSAYKRKTRTPKKFSSTDGESTESGLDRRENIPMVRTRRSSRSLGLDIDEEENKANELDSSDPIDTSQARTNVSDELNNDSDVSGATSQSEDNTQKKGSVSRISKSMMPEVRLTKHTNEEIVQMVKDIKNKKIYVTGSYLCNSDKDSEPNVNDGQTQDESETDKSVNTKSVNSTGIKRKLADDLFTSSAKKVHCVNLKGLSKKYNPSEQASASCNEKEVQMDDDDIIEQHSNSETHVCPDKSCLYFTSNQPSLERHVAVFHGSCSEVQDTEKTLLQLSESTSTSQEDDTVPIDLDEELTLKQAHMDVGTDEILCPKCSKTFKTPSLMKKHYMATHSERQFKCSRCDYVARIKSNLNTHMKLKHSLSENEVWKCQFCCYGTIVLGNLKNHVLHAHGLIIVSSRMKTNSKFSQFKEGDIVTLDGRLYDPKTMLLPKNRPRTVPARREKKIGTASSELQVPLSKLPVNDFLEQVMKRHEDYMKKPEKNVPYMSSSIAKATEQPSFPQASPQIRNNHVNKIYNMQKMKLPVQESSFQGYVTVGIPNADNEVEVAQHDYPEVVIENVESGESNDVLTISEQSSELYGEEMIIINKSGKQTVVRSKDFFDTLSATGHDTNKTLEVIAALLQAGEQIEIREQGEQEDFVEIQNA